MAILPILGKLLFPNQNRKISEAGLELIKKFEDLRLRAYLDEKGIPTIGWGHIKGIQMGMQITVEKAESYLIEDLYEAETAVRKLVTVPLSQNQYDSLVSFTFNLGSGALQVSTLRRLLNNHDYASVPAQMLRWNKVKVNGEYRVSNGLTKRRALEGKIFTGV